MNIVERALKKAIADIEQLQGAYELMSTLADMRKEEIESLKSRAERAEAERDNLAYTIEGVMHFVDKWLDGKELEINPVNRAELVRSKTLEIIENLEKENTKLKKQLDKYNECRIENSKLSLSTVKYQELDDVPESGRELIKELIYGGIISTENGVINLDKVIYDMLIILARIGII